MKTYGGVDVQFLGCLTVALHGDWSASYPGHFNPGTHWIERWVGSRSLKTRNTSWPNIKSNHLAPSQPLYRWRWLRRRRQQQQQQQRSR